MSDIKQYKYISFHDKAQYRRYVSESDSEKLLANEVAIEDKVKDIHGSYGALLFHPRWKARRQQILERDHFQCVICKSNSSLQVHHRQYHFIVLKQEYKLPWDYADYLMITLCENCHRRGHYQYKVPTIKI
jgi:hypothetical protein